MGLTRSTSGSSRRTGSGTICSTRSVATTSVGCSTLSCAGDSRADRLAAHLPARPIPHHLFHVAFVGVGAVTGHVPTTLPNMESCRPAWASVIAPGPGPELTVERPSLVVDRGRLGFGAVRRLGLRFDPAVVPGVHAGHEVAIHWGWPALVLSARQSAALREYSRRSLDAANEALPALGTFAPGA